MTNKEFNRYMQSMEFHTDCSNVGWCSDETGKVLEIDIINSTHEWEGDFAKDYNDAQLDRIYSELYQEIIFKYEENVPHEY